jgi:hypothetical protein
MELNELEYTVLLQSDFSTFIQRSFTTVSTSSDYRHNWHIDLIASKLEQCRKGEIKRLIINIPPRNLKSICASVAFPAWLLAHDPSAEIICASYGQELSHKHAMDTRNVMQSYWYQQLFPARLDKRKTALEDFMTTKGGVRIATSVGGALTGRGGGFLIIDDPLKPTEAVSETQRNQVNNWYDGTLYTRLNDKVSGCIIIIMQRLHEDDLVGHVLEQEGWEVEHYLQSGEITSSSEESGSIFIMRDISLSKVNRGSKVITDQIQSRCNMQLIKAITRSYLWHEQLINGEVESIAEIRRLEKLSDSSYVAKIMRLRFLAPDIIEKILSGRQPSHWTIAKLFEVKTIEWASQRQQLGLV